MSSPLSPSRLKRALEHAGLRVVTYDGWETHNRNHKGPWGPMHGVMLHHTVTEGTEHSVAMCRNGYSSLPGPLCHGVIDKAGTVHLISAGRANHAGLGDDDVLKAVIAEKASLPADNEANTDGNRHFYGFECVNLGDGDDPWPQAQLDAMEKASAAICKAHGWNEYSVIRHLDWQPGKVDPRGINWSKMRDNIGALIDDDKPTPPVRKKYEPFPGAAFFKMGHTSPIVAAMHARLIAVGCNRYKSNRNIDTIGSGDENSYEAWQRMYNKKHRKGWSGSALTWPPGKETWDALRVPNV